MNRSVELLQCFTTADRELSSRELVRRSGLPRPTVFRITTSLRRLRLVRYNPERGTFSLGLRLLAVSGPVLARFSVRKIAHPLMQNIADSFDAQVVLAVGEDRDLLIVDNARAATSSVFQLTVGVRLSLSRTATGLAYLLSLSADARGKILDELAKTFPGRTSGLAEKLSVAEAEISAQGYCLVRSKIRPEVAGVAAALRSSVDGESIVFGCSLLSVGDTQQDRIHEAGLRIAALARSMDVIVDSGPELRDSGY